MTTVSSSALSTAIVGALKPFVAAGSLAGAVTLVADKDHVLSLDCVGFADIGAKKPMQPDTLFWIASQTKPITATALMMLVDEGKLTLDDPVADYLPEFAGQWVIAEQDNDHLLLRKPTPPITVRHILCHTSGMSFASAVEQPTLDQLPIRTAVRSYAIAPLLSEPGTVYRYSNAGTNTAGCLIEVLTGESYVTFLQNRLLDPLGMTDTTFWPNEEQVARLAKAYRPNADNNGLEETTISQMTYPLTDPRRQPFPAGGLFSTAHDVARFCQMILNGGTLDGRHYLSEVAIREMSRKQTGDLPESYGLGWGVGNDGSFGHGGALSTNMNISPETGRVTVFLVQHAGFPPGGNDCYGAFQKAVRERDQG
jgi:CubicO group peptidase (beta-lactamase class C family)